MDRNEVKEKQNIKAQRIKSYFLQAAKEIILREGVENVTVRKVADLAGYSYATIYNYFKDLNELLLEIKTEMIQEMIRNMANTPSKEIYDIDDIKTMNRQYIRYYMDHPNIYRFFYLYKFSEKSESQEVLDFSDKWRSIYRGFVIKKIIKEAEVMIVAKVVIYTIQGLLALYFSDNGLTEEMVYKDLDEIADYFLKGDQL